MKSILFIIASALIIAATFFIDLKESTEQMQTKDKFTIVIHGGAGTISKDISDSVKNEYIKSLSEALNIGKEILEKGGTSLDAVEQVIRFLEDDPKFNAGKGAVYTSDGIHELDASIMDGNTLKAGAVTLIKHVKNPIFLARLVMEKTPHVYMGGEGAENFAREMNLEFVPNDYFDTKRRQEQLQRAKERIKGTVGCVALDKHGNLAAATSTGGKTNKLPGRVSDTSVIGAGNYANNKTCAVSGTGDGEEFIKHNVAQRISALMEYKNLSLQEAANEVIFNILKKGDGGIIAVDKDGNYSMTFNSQGMYRGAATSDEVFEVEIW